MKPRFISKSVLAATLLSTGALATAQAEETWKPIGTGMLRDDVITTFYFLSDYYEFPVEVEECEQIPGRYRLVNAYKNCPSIGGPAFPEVTNYLVVDASDPVHVYVEPGCVSYYIGEGQALCIWSIADDYFNNRYSNWDKADEEGVCGTLADGTITFPKGALLTVPIEDLSFDPSKHDFIWQQTNLHGMFRLKLPGTPNTDIGISFIGINQDNTSVNYDLEIPEDIEYVKVGVFKSEYYDDMRIQIEQDKVQTARIDRSGVFEAPYDEDGTHTVMAVPYANGKSYTPTYITREWSFSEAEWKKMGKAMYTEAILSSNELRSFGFVIDEYEYEVEIEQNVADPTMIRMVDPYGTSCYPDATEINFDSSKRHDLYFDLGRFDCVHLLHNPDIGINLGQGHMSVRSMSDLYINDRPYGDNMTLEEYMADSTLPKCTYNQATHTINCEPKALRLLFPEKRPDAWYLANLNGKAKVVLPSDIFIPNAVEGITDDKGIETEYFTIDGIKTDSSNLKSGIYIVRRGKNVSKMLVK